MDPSLPTILAGACHLALTGPRLLRRRSGHRPGVPAASTVVVLAAAAGVLEGSAVIELRLAVAGTATAGALTAHWHGFRAGRFGLPFRVAMVVIWAETLAWSWALLGLASELYATAPFGGVLAGILGFFLPVNGAAEVFRAGRDALSPRR